jgi:DNA-directed RNA polymerase subunit beta
LVLAISKPASEACFAHSCAKQAEKLFKSTAGAFKKSNFVFCCRLRRHAIGIKPKSYGCNLVKGFSSHSTFGNLTLSWPFYSNYAGSFDSKKVSMCTSSSRSVQKMVSYNKHKVLLWGGAPYVGASAQQRESNSLTTQLIVAEGHKKKQFQIHQLETYHRSNQDTCLVHKPAVKVGEWVESGDLLADNSASMNGELAIGKNIIVAYMPWEGFNYEDAILINERLVYDDVYTSIHIERYEIETKNSQSSEASLAELGGEQITREIPDINPESIAHLDKYGIASVGSWIEAGDILVGKVTPINKKTQTPYQRLLFKLLDKTINTVRDSSLRAPRGIKANVIHVQILSASINPESKNKKQKAVATAEITNKSLLNNSVQKPFWYTRKRVYNTLQNQNCFAHFSNTLLKGSKHHRCLEPFKSQGFIKNVYKEKNKVMFLTNLNTPKYSKSFYNTRFQGSFQLVDFGHKQKVGFGAFNLLNTAQKTIKPKKEIMQSKGIKAGYSEKREFKSTYGAFKFPAGSETHNMAGGQQLIPTYVHIYLAEKRKIQVGDKMAGRHGNKGIISNILPRQDMPYLPDGTAVDIVLNPLGVPSRMNVGQIYECLLGLAGKYLGEHYKIFPFDEIYGPEASRSFVFAKLFEASKKTGIEWLFDVNSPGKIRLLDGRTGECFDQPITVGIAYMLKLVHMVDDKMHMRSTGPYSLVTQQPLRGRAKQGGQRLGEMEVWAIEGYGAAFVLLEMLTLKSDDMTGRLTLWSNLILNKEITVGTPESFKVLVCELQALCLDIGLFNLTSNSVKDMQSNKKPAKQLKEISHLMLLP